MARPKSVIKRKPFTTTLDVDLLLRFTKKCAGEKARNQVLERLISLWLNGKVKL
jgi:hypothetical protein